LGELFNERRLNYNNMHPDRVISPNIVIDGGR